MKWRENRAAQRRSVHGLQVTWNVPDAPRWRHRKESAAAGVDVSEVGMSLLAPGAAQFAPGARVQIRCGDHQFSGILRRCDPLDGKAVRYGIEFQTVPVATIEKLLFYSRAERAVWASASG